MGSSHSYLLNLEAVATTPVHWMEEGLCLQVSVPDEKVHMALAMEGVAGECSKTAYTQFDYSKTLKLPGHGNLEFGVWEIPQQAGQAMPNWTGLATKLEETETDIMKFQNAMPLMNLWHVMPLMDLGSCPAACSKVHAPGNCPAHCVKQVHPAGPPKAGPPKAGPPKAGPPKAGPVAPVGPVAPAGPVAPPAGPPAPPAKPKLMNLSEMSLHGESNMSAHMLGDVFHTQNIKVDDINSAGNVDIKLMNLINELALHDESHMSDHMLGDVFHTQNIGVNQIDSAGNVNVGLQNLCDGIFGYCFMI